MDTANTVFTILRLLLAAGEWIAERIQAGEEPDAIERDIRSRRDEVAENRRKRDAEFKAKFGETP
jgi:hypothetical protein